MPHELDEYLKHHGVKGMRWNKHNSNNPEDADAAGGGDGDLEGTANEVYNILANGDFTGTGPWEEDSKTVDKLFDLREGFLKKVGDIKKNKDKAESFLKKFGSTLLGSAKEKKPHGKITSIKYETKTRRKTKAEKSKELRTQLSKSWRKAKDSKWYDGY